MLYQLGFIYRRPTCPNYRERFRFLIQALSTLEVIYHGRCIPELMRFVNKRFFGKNQCVILLQRRTARIEKSTKLVSHESLGLCYTVITQPVQDTVVLNKYINNHDVPLWFPWSFYVVLDSLLGVPMAFFF